VCFFLFGRRREEETDWGGEVVFACFVSADNEIGVGLRDGYDNGNDVGLKGGENTGSGVELKDENGQKKKSETEMENSLSKLEYSRFLRHVGEGPFSMAAMVVQCKPYAVPPNVTSIYHPFLSLLLSSVASQ
jgi:hypothetical protein